MGWLSIPSSSTPFGCPSLPPSSVPLAVSLPLASRGRSRSRTLETLYLDMVELWTGSTANSLWLHSSTSTSTASSTCQLRERSSSKSSCSCQRSSLSFSGSWKLLCFREGFCNPKIHLAHFLTIHHRNLLIWFFALLHGPSRAFCSVWGSHSFSYCSAFVIIVCDLLCILLEISLLSFFFYDNLLTPGLHLNKSKDI